MTMARETYNVGTHRRPSGCGRIHSHSLILESNQLRPFPFRNLGTTSYLGVELDLQLPWHFCRREFGHSLPYMEMFGTLWVISSGPTKLKANVSLSSSFLYPTHRYKKRCARYECHVKWFSGAIYPTWMFDSNPKLSCIVRSNEPFGGTVQPSRWTSLPQGNTIIWERRTVSDSLI